MTPLSPTPKLRTAAASEHYRSSPIRTLRKWYKQDYGTHNFHPLRNPPSMMIGRYLSSVVESSQNKRYDAFDVHSGFISATPGWPAQTSLRPRTGLSTLPDSPTPTSTLCRRLLQSPASMCRDCPTSVGRHGRIEVAIEVGDGLLPVSLFLAAADLLGSFSSQERHATPRHAAPRPTMIHITLKFRKR